jgi:four helix bundle protein
MADFMRVEDLVVYQKLCELHLEICTCARSWPREERFELGSQIRRSSNSAPANLAEKHSDRHIRNKIEGVNRARGEALETIHHLYVAKLKGYVSAAVYEAIRDRYQECVRMLNGLEKSLERQLPESQRRWNAGDSDPEPRTLNPEP